MDTKTGEAQEACADDRPLEKGGVAGVDSKVGKFGEPPTESRKAENDAKSEPKAN